MAWVMRSTAARGELADLDSAMKGSRAFAARCCSIRVIVFNLIVGFEEGERRRSTEMDEASSCVKSAKISVRFRQIAESLTSTGLSRIYL